MATPRPFYPWQKQTSAHCTEGLVGPWSIWMDAENLATPGLFLYSLVLCTLSLFFSTVLHFAFCLYLQHTKQISTHLAGFKLAIPASELPHTLTLRQLGHWDRPRSPDRPARSKSLYRLSYPGPQTYKGTSH